MSEQKFPFMRSFCKRFGRTPTDEELFEYIKLHVMSDKEDLKLIQKIRKWDEK